MQKKYETVVFWVLDEIESGNLSYGDRLPSEKDLMEKFQVSRQTIRRALEVLAEKGERHLRGGQPETARTEGNPDRSNAYLCGHLYIPVHYKRD